MATGTTGIPSPAAPLKGKPSSAPPKSSATNDRDSYILRQIQSTRNQVKNLELGQSFLLLVVGVLAFFLAVAVVDHWVISGGLSKWQRAAMLIVLLGGVGWYLWKKFLPLFMMRINPFYAAQTLEKSKPTMKNGLINYLWFRQSQAEMPEMIYNVIQDQTARGLTDVQIDQAIDRTPLIRIMYVLLGCIFTFSMYFLISPKNPFTTISRVVSPWSDTQSPSRVQITNIEPGTTKIYRGQSLTMKCEVANHRADEPVVLHYTTDDGQVSDVSVPMQLPAKGYRYECNLPAPVSTQAASTPNSASTSNVIAGGADDSTKNSSTSASTSAINTMKNPMPTGIPGMTDAELHLKLGLQQNFNYYITAGDAKTSTYRVQVESAPFIAVERIDFDYPAYTKIARETRNDPEITAIQGTRVTIHALANQPMKSGWIELLTTSGRTRESMKIDGLNGTASFTLNFKDDRQVEPEYTGYQLKFTNSEKRENPEPIRHSITITSDIPPSVEIVEPASSEKLLAPNQSFHVVVSAMDSDYGLANVRLVGEFDGKPLFSQNLLVASAEDPHTGKFQRSVDFTLDQLELKPGMSIEYWAEATDVKSPNPNVVQTNKRRLNILNPEHDREQQARDKQQAQNEQARNQQQNPGENPQNDPNNAANNAANNEQNPDAQNRDPKNQPPNNNQNQPPQQNARPDNNKEANPENRGENQNKTDAPDPSKNEPGKQGDNNRPQENTLNQKGGNEKPDQARDPKQDQENNPAKQRDPASKNSQQPDAQNRNENSRGSESKPNGNGQKSDSNPNDPKNSNQDMNSQSPNGQEQSTGQPTKEGEKNQTGQANNQPKPQEKSGRPTEEQKKVKNDGSEDGKAMQKFLDDAEEKLGNKSEQKNPDGTDPKDPKNKPEQQLAQNDNKNPGKSGQDQKQSDARDEQQKNGGKKPDGNPGEGRKQSDSKNDSNEMKSGKNEPGKEGENKKGPNDKGQGDGGSNEKSDVKKGSNSEKKQQPGQNSKDPNNKSGQNESKQNQPGGEQKDDQSKGKNPTEQSQDPGREQGSDKAGEKGSDKNEDGKQGNNQSGQEQKPAGQQKPNDKKSAQQQSGQPGQEKSQGQNAGGMNPSENQPENQGKEGQGQQGQQGQGQQAQGNPQNQTGQPMAGKQGDEVQGKNGDASKQGADPQGKSQKQDGVGTQGSANEQRNQSSNESAKSGSPSAQKNSPNAPEKGKPAQASEGGRQQSTDPAKQSDDKSPSNAGKTEGESDGDRAGGGKKGQGNPSKSQGKGSPGTSTPDDSGANSTQQKGMGETGSQAGDQVKSDGKTGQAGNEPGKGSSSRTTQQQNGTEEGSGSTGQGNKQGRGEQVAQNDPNGKSGEPGSVSGQGQAAGKQSDQETNQPGKPNNNNGKAGNGPDGNFNGNGGGGKQSGTDLPAAQQPMQNAAEEKVNEEYSKKATDLVLEHLKNQIRDGKVDADVLKQLGWTADELKQFVARWEQLRAEAQKPGPEGEAAQKKLDDRIKSLGLRPTQTTRANSTAGDDNYRGNTESRRTAPPAEFRQMFNEFKKATSGK